MSFIFFIFRISLLDISTMSLVVNAGNHDDDLWFLPVAA